MLLLERLVASLEVILSRVLQITGVLGRESDAFQLALVLSKFTRLSSHTVRMFVIGNSESVYQNPFPSGRLKGLVQLSYGKRHRGTTHIIELKTHHLAGRSFPTQ
jgi:hypothetical protein